MKFHFANIASASDVFRSRAFLWDILYRLLIDLFISTLESAALARRHQKQLYSQLDGSLKTTKI
jgi:hypothetical protein